MIKSKTPLLKFWHLAIFLFFIFVVAAIIRIYPIVNSPEAIRYGLGSFGDSRFYQVIAYNIYKGNGFSRVHNDQPFGLNVSTESEYAPALTRAPVYPFFISQIYRSLGSEQDMQSASVWHKNWNKIRIVQCVMDALICILVFFITRAITQGAIFPALISAGLYCFSFYNIYYTKAILSESVAAFLLTLALLLCVLGMKHDRLYLWGLSGALFGLVILTRAEFILFPLVFIIYMVTIDRAKFSDNLKKSFLFFIAAAVVVVPWTVRNYYVSKQFIPVAISGIGMSLFLGTCETNSNWQGWTNLPDDAFNSKEEKAAAQLAYDAMVRDLPTGSIKVKDTDSVLMKLALERISAQPFECFKRWAMKIPRLWYQFYIPMYAKREASGGFFIFYFVCALFALCRGSKEERGLMAPVGLVFLYLTCIFFPLHIEPRYGVALMPGIICLASIGIWKALPWQCK